MSDQLTKCFHHFFPTNITNIFQFWSSFFGQKRLFILNFEQLEKPQKNNYYVILEEKIGEMNSELVKICSEPIICRDNLVIYIFAFE